VSGLPCALPANAGDAEVKGLELETSIRPVAGLLIDASLSYIDFEYAPRRTSEAGADGFRVVSRKRKYLICRWLSWCRPRWRHLLPAGAAAFEPGAQSAAIRCGRGSSQRPTVQGRRMKNMAPAALRCRASHAAAAAPESFGEAVSASAGASRSRKPVRLEPVRGQEPVTRTRYVLVSAGSRRPLIRNSMYLPGPAL